jgi:hypothetical protein
MIASMDITPEHTARIMDNDLHPEVRASYAYVDWVSHTADIQAAPGIPAWHGWAIREAFLAGCSHAAAESQPEPEEVKAWMYRGEADFDGENWRENWEVTLDEKLARFKSGNKEPVPLWTRPTIQPEPEFTADEMEMIQAPWSYLASANSLPAGHPHHQPAPARLMRSEEREPYEEW